MSIDSPPVANSKNASAAQVEKREAERKAIERREAERRHQMEVAEKLREEAILRKKEQDEALEKENQRKKQQVKVLDFSITDESKAAKAHQSKTTTEQNTKAAPESNTQTITKGPEAKRQTAPESNTQSAPNGMSEQAVDKTTKELHDAAFNTWMGMSSPDTKKLQDILSTVKEADRKSVEESYQKQFPGHNLRDDLKTQLGADSPQYKQMEALLNRKDGQSDEAGQIERNLAVLHQLADKTTVDRVVSTAKALAYYLADPGHVALENPDVTNKKNAENDIVKTLASLDAAGIQRLSKQYGDNYNGQDLKQTLLNNPDISAANKEAIAILLKGNERSTEDTLKLADIALKSGQVELFKVAFQNASPEARAQFKANGGDAQIDKTFPDKTGQENKLAHDYLESGKAKLSTLIEGDTHWYHTNQEAISSAVSSATDEERQMYKTGKQIASDGRKEGLTADEDKALGFYLKVHQALMDARNSDREVSLWEAQLLNAEKLGQNMLKTHSDGWFTTFNWNLGAGHKADDFYKQVENLSKEDWTRFRDHPEDLSQLKETLSSIATPEEQQKVLGMLGEKLCASDYEASKLVGRRGVEEIIKDGGDKLDAIAHMTQKERDDYKNNAAGFADRLNALAANDSSVDKVAVAKYLLKHLDQHSEEVTRALVDSTRTSLDDPAASIRNMEEAFKKDPTLLERIKNTEEAIKKDKQLDSPDKVTDDVVLTRAFQNLVSRAALAAEPGQTTYSEETYDHDHSIVRAGNYQEFKKSLWETGKLDIEHRLELDKRSPDALAMIKDLAQATPEERERAYKLQGSQFNGFLHVSDEEKKLVDVAIKQGSLNKVDEYHAALVSPNRSDEQRKVDLANMKADFERMTPEQKQDMANEYFTKYGSLLSVDVLDKAEKNDQWRLRELLSPTDVNVRQVALDARAERDTHTSMFDPALNKLWDYSQVAAQERADNLNKFIVEHQKEIDSLKPEQRQKFVDAVANYEKAEKDYIESKGKFAEAFVDATITVAAIGGAVFSGGTSLSLLATVGAGGAVYRVAAMKAIQGADFDDSAKNILKQGFEGGTAAMLGFLGPEALGIKGLSVGEEIAAQTSRRLVEDAATAQLFKQGSESVLKQSLSKISREGAIVGEKEITALAEKVAADGVDKAAVEQAIRQQLKNDVTNGLRNKIMNEAESYLKNMAAAQIGGAGKEVAATAAGFEDPETLWQRLGGTAVSTAVGATLFHVGFRAVKGAVETGKAVIGRDSEGFFLKEGTIKHKDGRIETVEEGKTVRLEKGDQIVENNETKTVKPFERTSKLSSPENLQEDNDFVTRTRDAFKSAPETQPQAPSDAAYRQSREWDLTGKIDGKLQDGATLNGTVVDSKSPLIKAYMDYAIEKYGHLPPAERAEAYARFAKLAFHDAGRVSEDSLDAMHVNKVKNGPANLDSFAKDGDGACLEQSIFLKLLADRHDDWQVRLVIGTAGDQSVYKPDQQGNRNHAWTEISVDGQPARVYDPRNRIFGKSYSDLDGLTPAHNLLVADMRDPVRIQGADDKLYRFKGFDRETGKYGVVYDEGVAFAESASYPSVDAALKDGWKEIGPTDSHVYMKDGKAAIILANPWEGNRAMVYTDGLKVVPKDEIQPQWGRVYKPESSRIAVQQSEADSPKNGVDDNASKKSSSFSERDSQSNQEQSAARRKPGTKTQEPPGGYDSNGVWHQRTEATADEMALEEQRLSSDYQRNMREFADDVVFALRTLDTVNNGVKSNQLTQVMEEAQNKLSAHQNEYQQAAKEFLEMTARHGLSGQGLTTLYDGPAAVREFLNSERATKFGMKLSPESERILNEHLELTRQFNYAKFALDNHAGQLALQAQEALNKRAQELGLPQVKVVSKSPEEMGSAGATYSNGIIRVRSDVLVGLKGDAVETIAHEYFHLSQEVLMAQNMADELAAKGELTPFNLKKLYNEKLGRDASAYQDDEGGLKFDIAKYVVENRQGPLSAELKAKAEALEDVLRTQKSVDGKEHLNSANKLRSIDTKMQALDASDGAVTAEELINKIAQDHSVRSWTELVGGDKWGRQSEQAIAMRTNEEKQLLALAEELKKHQSGQPNGWDAEKARQILFDMLTRNQNAINDWRMANWSQYFTMIERDAHRVQQIARQQNEERLQLALATTLP